MKTISIAPIDPSSAKTKSAPSASDVAVHNGAFLGLDVSVEEADIVIFPIPWDVTTSYRAGTVRGPEAVIEASYQLDLFSPYLANVADLKIGTIELSKEWYQRSAKLREKTARYITFLEEGGQASESPEMQKIIAEANAASLELQVWSQTVVRDLIQQGKRVLTLGGDHSVPMGPIAAHLEAYPEMSVLHFDAHADLREAYEGFHQSHASIMFNVLQLPNLKKLVQVGIRDVSPVEVELIEKDPRVVTYFDWSLQESLQEGKTWKEICDDIVSKLGPEVYISFDIDGLDPKLCPNTGTPVPGGLEMPQAIAIIQAVVKSGRKVVGADLVEVAPGPDGDQWDGNVGARILFQMMVAVAQTRT